MTEYIIAVINILSIFSFHTEAKFHRKTQVHVCSLDEDV